MDQAGGQARCFPVSVLPWSHDYRIGLPGGYVGHRATLGRGTIRVIQGFVNVQYGVDRREGATVGAGVH